MRRRRAAELTRARCSLQAAACDAIALRVAPHAACNRVTPLRDFLSSGRRAQLAPALQAALRAWRFAHLRGVSARG